MTARPVLYVIGCGARPSADLPEFAAWSIGEGWDTCAVLTPAALKFPDPAMLAEVTGHPARSDYKRPEEPDVLPPPDALAGSGSLAAPGWRGAVLGCWPLPCGPRACPFGLPGRGVRE
jgi:hypothetical protein